VTLLVLADIQTIDSVTTAIGVPLSVIAVAVLVATDAAAWLGPRSRHRRAPRHVRLWAALAVITVLVAWLGVVLFRFLEMAT
jgi:hypothetical protein